MENRVFIVFKQAVQFCSLSEARFKSLIRAGLISALPDGHDYVFHKPTLTDELKALIIDGSNGLKGGGELCQSTGKTTKTEVKPHTSILASKAQKDADAALGLNQPRKARKGERENSTTVKE